MNSPSFKGFHAQLNCKFTYGNKNETQLALVWYKKFRIQKQNRKKKQMMKNVTRHNC